MSSLSLYYYNALALHLRSEGAGVPFYCVPLRWQLYEEGPQALGAGVPRPL